MVIRPRSTLRALPGETSPGSGVEAPSRFISDVPLDESESVEVVESSSPSISSSEERIGGISSSGGGGGGALSMTDDMPVIC